MENDKQWLKEFGARLRKQREYQRLTRLQLAERAHTEQGYIVQIERGDRSPSLRTFINLLSALDVSADSLLFHVEDEFNNDKQLALNAFTAFLARMNSDEIKSVFEIVKLIAIYKNTNKSNV